MHVLMIAAALVLLILSRKKTQQQRTELAKTAETSDKSTLASINRQVAVHTSLHSGLDLRATVYLLGYFSVLAVEATLFKDNFGLLPQQFMLAVACVILLGGVSTAIALFARNWVKPRTSEKILHDERQATLEQLEYAAAARLAECERTSRRKIIGSDMGIAFLTIELIMFAFGMARF